MQKYIKIKVEDDFKRGDCGMCPIAELQKNGFTYSYHCPIYKDTHKCQVFIDEPVEVIKENACPICGQTVAALDVNGDGITTRKYSFCPSCGSRLIRKEEEYD